MIRKRFLAPAVFVLILGAFSLFTPQESRAFGICDRQCQDMTSCEIGTNTICVLMPFTPCENGGCT